MVLFPSETNKIKNDINNDRFVEVKPKIDDVVQKALNAGFGIDGLLIGELLHLKVHVNAFLGILTEEPSMTEFPNKIKLNQQSQKDQCIETIEGIRNIQ